MARVEDYIGQSFGDFIIGRVIGQGAEADVLECLHRSTGIVYILRLAVSDKDLWQEGPVIPPHNSSIEVPNALGTWEAAQFYYGYTMEELQKDGSPWKMVTPAIYGVLNNRYLVPVASPIRVKNAWDITRVLTEAPPDDLFLFEMWKDFLGSLVGAAHIQSVGKLQHDPWRRLVGGRILTSAVTDSLRGGTLSQRERSKIVDIAGGSQVAGPEFAENIILRLCGCVQRGRMTLAEAIATLQCRYFRANVTQHELQQMVDLYAVLQQSFGVEASLNLLLSVLLELSKEPIDQHDDTDRFEIRDNQPDLSLYDLFLQDYAGKNQKVIVLEASRK